jgi:endogenous inhibitor of DNA gyrase (YacG/DUF329 family)
LPENTGRFAPNAAGLIDLGKWLEGEHAISKPLPEGLENELADAAS